MSESLHINFDRLDPAELQADEQELLRIAFEALNDAYVPYSRFRVGCALLLESGEVLTGNNQENRAFPSGLCAERTALFFAGSKGLAPGLRKVAIRAKSPEKVLDEPVTPCGACRQVMLEYEQIAGRDLVVLMQGESGKVLRLTGVGKTLLPFGFEIDF